VTTKEIANSGGDYTTLAAWVAALPATFTTPQIANCHNFALTESAGVVISGFTTSSSNYLQIQAVGANQHTGTPGTGFSVTSSIGSGGTIRFGANVDYWNFIGLEITAGSGSAAFLDVNGHNSSNAQTLSNCLLHTTSSVVFYLIQNKLTANLNIIYTVTGDRALDVRSATSIAWNRNTFYSNGADYTLVAGGESVATGCYAGGASNSSFLTSQGITGSYNGSDDGSASAGSFTNGTTSATGSAQFTSVTPSSENFHLKGTSALLDVGTAIGGISVDIIGTSIPQGSAPDIGAFEYIVASAAQSGFFLLFPSVLVST
jgi:hypothetical protein